MADDDDVLKKFAVPEDEAIKPIDMMPSPAAKPAVPAGSVPAPDVTAPRRKKTASADPEAPDHLQGRLVDEKMNFIKQGEYVDIIEKDPTIKRVMVGAGWDQKGFDGDGADLDMSIFLLDKTDNTRMDEDFVFYNQPIGCEGAVRHMGDSRTGAGDGDDENILLDLNGIPFDVLKLMFVISIYDEELRGDTFTMVKNVYIRIVNRDDGNEIVRYQIEDKILEQGGTGMYAAVLIREGPRWIFEAVGKVNDGGLGMAAKNYGIIVKELLSTAITGTDAEQKSTQMQKLS